MSVDEIGRAFIAECLEELNYKLIAKTMKRMNWTWTLLGRVPTTDEIHAEARQQLEAVWAHAMARETKFFTTGSGGFEIVYARNKKRYTKATFHQLQISFAISGWYVETLETLERTDGVA